MKKPKKGIEGQGVFMGDVHPRAARIDGMIELGCGAFSRSASCAV